MTERWTRDCERRDSSGVSLGVRAMRTIPGCIARAPAQVGKGVYREVPRISGSPQKSAGQIWVFVRCEPFLDASCVPLPRLARGFTGRCHALVEVRKRARAR
mgnify:CR=1 FL=1